MENLASAGFTSINIDILECKLKNALPTETQEAVLISIYQNVNFKQNLDRNKEKQY